MNSSVNKKRVYIFFLAGFLMPPTTWLAGLVFYSMMSMSQMWQIAFNPALWGYVFLFVGIVTSILHKNIKKIQLYLDGSNEKSILQEAQKSVSFIPKFFMFAISVYVPCGVPVVTHGKEFVTRDIFLYSLYISLPIVLLFAIPFWTYITINLEKWTSSIPFHEEIKGMRLSARLFINMVVTTVGMVTLIFLFVLTYLNMEHTKGHIVDNEDLIIKVFILSTIAVALIILNFYNLLKQLIVPIKQTEDRLKDVAEGDGDLRLSIEIISRDEIGELASFFNTFISKLKTVVIDTKSSAEKVTLSSNTTLNEVKSLSAESGTQARSAMEISTTIKKLSTGMQEISKNAEEQQNSLQTLRDNMGVLKQNTDDVVNEVNESQGLAKNITRIAREGEKAMNKMNSSIGSITRGAKEMNAILKIISDISKRTNLLALNASIEAARAGESGQGFAVVADEIAKLADKTAMSLNQIQTLVNSSVADIEEGQNTSKEASLQFHNILSSIDDIIHKMDLLCNKIDLQYQSNQLVHESVEEVFNRSLSIQKSTTQQQQATHEIESRIINITGVTDAIVKRSDTLSANTEKVNYEMNDLKKKIGFFKTS
ncbi:MAG: HAMP domain-containing protein [Leptospiraceae bacterium]|nr:HAMP domain-containing protein [Leptospiraceae bacterium]